MRIFQFHFAGGEGASGSEFWAFAERAPRALPHVVNFSSLGSNPARPELTQISNCNFPGGRVRLGPSFLQLIRGRMVLYLLVSISARSVPSLLGQFCENFSISFCRGEGASGSEFWAFAERALRALPHVVSFSSLGFNSARPEIRQISNCNFPGGRVRLGPSFLQLIRGRMVLYLLVSISARSVPSLLGQFCENFSISFCRGGGCVWVRVLGICRKSA